MSEKQKTLRTARVCIIILTVAIIAIGVVAVVPRINSSRHANTSSTDSAVTLVGKWKSTNGDLLQINEDGTYWKSGRVSEQGRYRIDTVVLDIGSDHFYRTYDWIRMEPNDFSGSTECYYQLSGSSLDMCYGVNKNTGEFDSDATIHYRRQ